APENGGVHANTCSGAGGSSCWQVPCAPLGPLGDTLKEPPSGGTGVGSPHEPGADAADSVKAPAWSSKPSTKTNSWRPDWTGTRSREARPQTPPPPSASSLHASSAPVAQLSLRT